MTLFLGIPADFHAIFNRFWRLFNEMWQKMEKIGSF